LKKLFLSLLLFISTLSFLVSQNKLTSYNTSWTTVIPGKVLSEPVLTSFGFVLYSDAKAISAFSENGKALWDKSISGRDIKITCLPEDFIFVYADSTKTISLFNPSGYMIWDKKLDSKMTDVLPGRDGRIFIKGQNFISCYGITGIRKWNLNTEALSSINIQELPDGSLIIFYAQITEGKTKGIRISPFGEILEEITFNGQIISAATCNDGILVTFSEGTPGFFSLSSENLCENKWVLKDIKASKTDKNQIEKARFLVSQDKESVAYVLPYKNFVQVYKINTTTGISENDFSLQNIKGFDLTNINYSNKEIFIADDSIGYLISDTGKDINSSVFQSQSKFKWNYVFLTKADNLVFCGTNWTLNAYKLNQDFATKTETKNPPKYEKYFPIEINEYTFAFINKLDFDFASQERVNDILKGDYGAKEIKWAAELEQACLGYNASFASTNGNSRKENTVFDLDTPGTEKMLLQLAAFGDDQFNKYTASFLSKMTNKTLAGAVLNGIIINGYDPDQQILTALEKFADKTNYKDEVTLSKICDSVYSICLFMGRPAFNSKGKDILSKFLFPSYKSSTRVYARETLRKISELEM